MYHGGPPFQPWLHLHIRDFLKRGGDVSKRSGGGEQKAIAKARKANISIDNIHKKAQCRSH